MTIYPHKGVNSIVFGMTRLKLPVRWGRCPDAGDETMQPGVIFTLCEGRTIGRGTVVRMEDS